jgi:hypothetical protein
MEHTAWKLIEKRGSPRNPTEIEIICHPYTSTGAKRHPTGILRNCSIGGIYIEMPHEYKSGTILVIRTTRYSPSSCALTSGEGLRTICLAEVRWQQDLSDHKLPRYGLGLRYLD